METKTAIVHIHVFDGPEVEYEWPYLGGSVMTTLKSKTCSTCGFLEDDFRRLLEGPITIA